MIKILKNNLFNKIDEFFEIQITSFYLLSNFFQVCLVFYVLLLAKTFYGIFMNKNNLERTIANKLMSDNRS